ncbi:hypothetical protein CO652_25885 [Rhizobium sp. H4]|uniref:hypothetical protein n=1 Tax=Rhizobium TaxID=379 RepID=UPI000BE8027C|nr:MULTISPECIES: hypothetical protein [Rhizobium]PDV85572.1 hypothetical protein CO652_25885 [Rhizobium sp. H4]WET74360.1 hypothetical protein PYR68_02165 [Rhizobium croatiense]
MAISIPGLSKAAEERLIGLIEAANDEGHRRDALAASLGPVIRQELAAVSLCSTSASALMPSLRRKDLINRVPSAARDFKAIRERLKVPAVDDWKLVSR